MAAVTRPETTYDCLLCEGPLSHWLRVPRDWRRPHDQRSYELYWCAACSFGQVEPRPSQADVRDFYDTEYYTHAALAPRKLRPGFAERLRTHLAWRIDRCRDLSAELVDQLVESRPARICEIGCGDGTLLQALSEHGHRVAGLEPDPLARKAALARGIEAHAGEAEDLPQTLAQGSFDVVILRHVLEHCLDPLRALEGARSLLRPGGLLVCETPNNVALGLRQAGAHWPWLDVPRHLNFFSAESLRRICERVGIRVRTLDFAGYTRQFAGTWLEEEGCIRAALDPARPGSARGRELQSWYLLARTALAPRSRKYDSVRVTAEA